MSVDDLTHGMFVSHAGTEFVVADGAVRLVLAEVSELRSSPNVRSFSLLFHGPKAPFLPQGEYPLRHDVIGEFRLFIVPVGEDTDHYRYEAVFNQRPAESPEEG